MSLQPARFFCFAWLVVGIATFSAAGGEVADKIQPDRLNFGTLYLGGKAEGSVRIFVDVKEVGGNQVKVDPPAFVKIRSVQLGTQEYGKGNIKGYCDIAVSIDAEKAGDYAGEIVATIGGRRIEVPVETVVRPRRAGLSRVLVIETPFTKVSTDDGTLFNTWRKLVDRAELDVDYREVRAGKPVLDGVDLAKFDVVLLGELGIFRIEKSDIESLKDWVEKGGRVIVTANHFFSGTVEKANKLLLPVGLKMKDIEGPFGKDEITLDETSIPPCPFTEGVKSLYFHRPSPTEITNADRTMVLAVSPTEHGGNLVVLAMSGEGQVVAIGESLWWVWVTKADNAVLMGNLLRRRPKIQ